MSNDVEVLDVRNLLSEGGELVEVGGEEDRGAGFGGEVPDSVEERGRGEGRVGVNGAINTAPSTKRESDDSL